MATFILRGPSQAILFVVGTAVLAMMLPPLSVLSGAAIALVTLRNGPRFGAMVMLGSTAFVALMAWLSLGNVLPGVVFLAVLWLPLWVLGWVLREMRSLALATTVAGMLGIIGVLAVYAIVGDVSAWWQQMLLAMFEPAMEVGGPLADRAMVEPILANLSRIMTGIAAAGVSLNVLLCLFLARAWQAQLYNPGGFRSEFHALRLGQKLALMSLGFIALSLLPLGVVSHMAGEIVIVILSLYVIQGLALLHSIVAQRGLHVAWLVVLYLVMLFIMPHLLVLVAVMGLVDTWADFRRRLAAK
ncbi:MAG: YybS family protein [Gammaproteobacteria bacterium]|nr:YybS family protein [Gammaproteobacteria bacterium]